MHVNMHSAVWTLFITSFILLPQSSQQYPQNRHTRSNDDRVMAEQLLKQLTELREKLSLHNIIFDNVLDKTLEGIVLLESVNNFTATMKIQQNTISRLEGSLVNHERSTNATLDRQEQELNKLEPQLSNLEKRCTNQSSGLEQLKQLWDVLSNKSVARAAEVDSLKQTISGLQEGLTQQEAKINDKKLEITASDGILSEAKESLKSLQDQINEAMNTQNSLKGMLKNLQEKMEEERVSETPRSSRSAADATCSSHSAS